MNKNLPNKKSHCKEWLFLKLIPTRYRRGGGQPKVVEHPVVVKISHLVQWKQARFDLDQKKLATLRSTRGWTIPKMAEHYGVHPTTIKKYLYGHHLSGKKKGVRRE